MVGVKQIREQRKKKISHTRKVKVCICEGGGGSWRHVQNVTENERAGCLSGKEDIWES